MTAIFNFFYSIWNQVVYAISNIRIFDIIDIIIIAYIIYKAIGFLRETRAGQLVKGIIAVLILYVLSNWFNLSVLRWLLSILVSSALVLLVVIFQPELRRALERVGQSRLRPTQFLSSAVNPAVDCIDKICVAAGNMQSSKIGALIVFERKTQLGDIADSGTLVDAAPSVAIINNIFYPKSPLHDGAVIIRDSRVFSAGCILPLSDTDNISSKFGTRHRAAIGMTENSDAVVLVVSEETGNISIAFDGKITTNYSVTTASNKLKKLLIEPETKDDNSGFWGPVKKIFSLSKNKKTDDNEVNGNE